MDNNADKIKILIIEDDPDIREGVRILLESEGFAVVEAEDGRDGLQKLLDDIRSSRMVELALKLSLQT